MKKSIFLLIPLVILLLFACSKKSPTEASGTFILEVDNQSPLTLKIYVDDNFAGDSETNTKKEMGSFDKGENTHFEAKIDTLTVLDTHQDTRTVDKFILTIVF